MGLQIGDTIDDKYRIVKLLGEGGMGAVYEGENVRIHRRVAIKILHSNVASSEDAVQRFEREAQAAGRIGSEHIVEVLDLGDLPGGDRYMVMEYLDGQSLADRIATTGRMSPQATARIIIDMLDGLKAAHDAGIIHRDLKPDNVFLLTNKNGKKDFVKLVDFGISKFSSLGGEFSMTRTGAVMGTPYYLSPEQAKGARELDARADLYAVGVILYEAVAARVPFDGETFNELLFKIVLEPVPPLSTHVPDIDEHFAAIVEKSMARDPAVRFQTAAEMKEALVGWLEGQPAAPELLAGAATPVRPEMKSQIALDSNAGTIMQTNGAWVSTSPNEGAVANSKRMMIAAAAGLVLVLGGVGIYAMKSNDAEAQAAAQAEEEKSLAEEEKKREEEIARLEAEKAKAEAERAQADAARSEAEKAAAQAQLSAAEQARILAEEEKKRDAEEAKRTARATASPRPRPQPAPRPNPSTQPSSGGRKIRTEL